jgi:hypothetical protein
MRPTLHLTTSLGLVVALMVALGSVPLPAVAQDGTFVDDDGSVHEANIEAVAAAGITRGCNPPDNNRFCPDESVTRGQMAAFLVRAQGLVDGAGADLFVDDDDSVFENDIDRFATRGITRGCNPPDNDRFCPDEAVTRGQMAAFLVRAFEYAPAPPGAFVDTVGSVFEADIAALAQARVTLGCNPPDNNRFCPDQAVTRAEMATFLVRALGLIPIVPQPFDPDWYTTPEPLGLGGRTVVVTPGESPTLAEALADARPGDIIELAPGTHLNTTGNLVLRTSGTVAQWIAIRGAAGSRPVIDLEGLGEFRISASNVLLENVAIVDGSGNNLHIAPEEESVFQVVVRDVVISDLRDGPGAAIKLNRNNAFAAGVTSVYIEDSDLSQAKANAVVDGVGVSRVVVRDSFIHDNEPGSHGIFFKGGSEGILIEGNLISGIRQNAALQLGGNTGFGFFNPAWPDWEGVSQVARNNVIADFDDSAIEVRGVWGAEIHHNTIVGQSGFAIFRLSCGNTDTGGLAQNTNIDISNNLVIATGTGVQYARNDCEADNVRFGPTGWFGALQNSGSPTPSIPQFPLPDDAVAGDITGVVFNPDITGLTARAVAIARYTPFRSGPAVGAGEPLSGDVSTDMSGTVRSTVAPTLGAIE